MIGLTIFVLTVQFMMIIVLLRALYVVYLRTLVVITVHGTEGFCTSCNVPAPCTTVKCLKGELDHLKP